MNVIEAIKGTKAVYTIERLKSDLGILVKEYEEGLYVLNYDQINSPKSNKIAMECRGLILDREFNVVSRSFDRFFNYGEQLETQDSLDWSSAICYDKIDGSLIKIYNWKGEWFVSTRGTAFAESQVGNWGITFKELVFKALNCESDESFQEQCNEYLDNDITYLCEITSTENRVVTPYTGYTLYYLAARNNTSGEYMDGEEILFLGAKQPKQYSFGSAEACIEAAKNLKDLDEGYVVYQDGVPVCKIKSPAYVAIHHLRGEGTLNPKRIMELVLMNEQDEYLKYFPDDMEYFIPYVDGLKLLLANIEIMWNANKQIENQKDFAIKVKDILYSAILFQAKAKKQDPLKVFHEQRDSYKLKLLEEWVNG